MSLKHSLREGAVSVEHKSGDLLVPCILRFLRTIGRLIGLLHPYADGLSACGCFSVVSSAGRNLLLRPVFVCKGSGWTSFSAELRRAGYR